ncbi:MAG: hypothetical protein KF886_05050 [Candidatus Hydrogenedentes bacterium]|nr:hypothetical protein [Candidatus Hydrogenedentota bacterium]
MAAQNSLAGRGVWGAVIGTILLAVAGTAAASSVLLWPVAGRPAVASPGGTIHIALREEGAIGLSRGGEPYSLALALDPSPAGLEGRATLPESLPPGAYDVLVDSASGAELHRNVVYVLPEAPVSYTLAIVRGTALLEPGPEGASIAEGVAARISAASLVFAVGPFSREGAPVDYAAIRPALEGASIPVYLCPDISDLRSGSWPESLGAPVYGVTFGEDGYLVLGPGFAAQQARSSRWIGPAHRARRALRASRWSTGIVTRYGIDWDVRAQLALFNDDPLDYLVAMSVPPETGDTAPWGRTRIVPPAVIPRGAVILLDVGPVSIRLQQPSPASPTPPPAEAP